METNLKWQRTDQYLAGEGSDFHRTQENLKVIEMSLSWLQWKRFCPYVKKTKQIRFYTLNTLMYFMHL